MALPGPDHNHFLAAGLTAAVLPSATGHGREAACGPLGDVVLSGFLTRNPPVLLKSCVPAREELSQTHLRPTLFAVMEHYLKRWKHSEEAENPYHTQLGGEHRAWLPSTRADLP